MNQERLWTRNPIDYQI